MTVLDYNGATDDDELTAGLKQLCSDDILSLSPIKDAIEQGLAPTRAMDYNFIVIRGKNYSWVLEKMAIGFTTDFLTGFIED